MLNPNKQKSKIKVESRVLSQDPITGEVSESWIEQGKYWADLVPFSTKDQIQASAVQSKVKYTCRIRFSTIASQIDSTCRVIHRGLYYQLNGDPVFDNEGGRNWFTLNLMEAKKTWE